MKAGRTHMMYKAGNAVDRETEIIIAAEVYPGDQGDTTTNEDTISAAQTHLIDAQTECEIQELVAAKLYHSE